MQADIEGSTAFTTRVGDEVGNRVRDETKRVVREVAHAHGGVEIDAVGDAMMLTFQSTREAITAAIAVQNALAERALEHPAESLGVRIGINAGEVLHSNGRPAGAAVNAAARVMAKARGGEIYVSEMVRQLAGTVPGVTYRDRGRHAFKGWEQRWRLYEVDWTRPVPRPKPARTHGPVLRRSLFIGIAALGAAAGAVAVGVATIGDSSGGLSSVSPNHVGVIDPGTNDIVGQVPVGREPGPVAVGGGSVWVGNLGDRSLTTFDARQRSPRLVSLGDPPHTPTGLAVSEDGKTVWVAHGLLGSVSRIDAEFGPLPQTRVTSPSSGGSIVFGGGFAWAAFGNSTVAQIGPDGKLVAEEFVSGQRPSGVAYGSGSVWVSTAGDARVWELSPVSIAEAVDAHSVGSLPSGIVFGFGSVWVANSGDDTVT